MHTTQDARAALVLLLACVGAIALARHGEARWAAREPVPVAAPAEAATTSEATRLRDGQTLDLNRASAEELTLLPGVGPKLAREIVSVREKNGRFANVEALDKVRGIGPKKLAKLRAFVRVDGNEPN